MKAKASTINWNRRYYGDSEPHSLRVSSPGMIGTAMTVLVGMYSDDSSDVALIADRRSSPNADGIARGFTPTDDEIKTEALGDECAIGFCGIAMAQDIVMNRLRKTGPENGLWTLEHLIADLDEWLPVNSARIPGFERTGIIVAGRINTFPMLAWYDVQTAWQARPCFVGAIYFCPIAKDDLKLQEAIEFQMHRSHDCYLDRMKNAVRFCAERYSSVNESYVLRRLSNGFDKEEGIV